MKKNRMIQLAAGVLLLTACTSDFYEEYVNGRVPVNLGYEVLTAEESTRTAAATTLNDANIASGDAITVKIKNYNTAVSNYASYTYTAGASGAMTPPSPKPYYPTGSTNIDILAYYPSTAGNSSNFDVQADQTSDANYKASDLMVATKTNQARTTSTVALAFQHKMAKLVVTATKGDGVNTIKTITLKNVKRRVTFTNTSGAVGSATAISGTDVTLFKSGTGTSGTGAALIPAQTITGNVLEIVTDQGIAVYNVPAGKTFNANTKYTITVTVNRTAVGVTNSITWGSSASQTIQPTATETRYVATPVGAIPGLFTINADGDKVFFSKGNLQAKIASYSSNVATASEWKFADSQYSCIGNAAGNTSFAVGTWVDLFCWVGNSATNDTYGLITSTSSSQANHGNVSGESLKTDWGTAAASSIGTGWRTLTKDEWVYLFNTRTVNNGTGSGHSYTLGQKVNDVLGFVLYPDDYTGELYTTAQSANWSTFESAGCVFLPAAGSRSGTSVGSLVGSNGYYWSSTAVTASYAYLVSFGSGGLDPAYVNGRYLGYSVRLVRRAWYKEVSSATADDLGKIICSNGHIHTNVSDVACGGTAVAMIVYVGAAGTADASSSTYKGLAIALTDASTGSAWYGTSSSYSSTCVYQNSTFSNHYGYADMKGIANTNQMANKTGNCSSHTTHAAAVAARDYKNTVAVPANCSQWFLPSSGQWFKFFRNSKLNLSWTGWGYSAEKASGFTNVNKMFTDAGASGAVFSSVALYWSSSESSLLSAVGVGFYSEYGVDVAVYKKYNTRRVRAFLAF